METHFRREKYVIQEKEFRRHDGGTLFSYCKFLNRKLFLRYFPFFLGTGILRVVLRKILRQIFLCRGEHQFDTV